MSQYSFVKKSLAVSLALFPTLAIIAFVLHFHSWSAFFQFHWVRPPYQAERLFDALTQGRGLGFVIAHIFVDLAVPFLLLTILTLSWYLLKFSQPLAVLGAATGIIGSLAMAGVIASWLSFAAAGHVAPQYYDGARAALVELTRMQGILHVNTLLSYLTFYGLMILAGGLWYKRVFPAFNMLLVMAGSLLFILFMDMDNWMMIGTILLCVGVMPVMRRLWQS